MPHVDISCYGALPLVAFILPSCPAVPSSPCRMQSLEASTPTAPLWRSRAPSWITCSFQRSFIQPLVSWPSLAEWAISRDSRIVKAASARCAAPSLAGQGGRSGPVEARQVFCAADFNARIKAFLCDACACMHVCVRVCVVLVLF